MGGGISGVALGVANTNQRESGLEAIREADRFQHSRGLPPERGFDTLGSDNPYVPDPPLNPNRMSYPPPPSNFQMSQPRDPFASPAPSRRSDPFDDNNGSPTPTRGSETPRGYPSATSIPTDDYPPQDAYANSRTYSDNPYNRYSSAWDPRVSRADIDPNEIDDDGDDMMATEVPRRRSNLGFNNRSQGHGPEAAAAGGGAGILGSLGGLVGNRTSPGSGTRDASGQYGPIGGPPADGASAEKSQWLHSQTSGRKRLRWLLVILLALILIGAIVGGVIGAITRNRSSSSGSSSSQGQSAEEDADANGDLDKDSSEIKKLLNNPDLHKVFPAVDYTPFNAQYPECLSNMPSQNNVTRDVAVLSQLTNAVRLYGTDCNQTEMVLHAIDKLDLKDVKIWIGVWLDKNQTTNDRGIKHMYELVADHGSDPFAGVIIGNEVLYREDLTIDELGEILDNAKKNFTSQNIDLPVATSDLGDDWTAELAAKTDIVMSNVHPFFAGVEVEQAASWTWNFWKTKDLILTEGTTKKNLISEVGWPSGGGKNCGEATDCDVGSVAKIENMNKFMDSFVCQSLANSTDFFW